MKSPKNIRQTITGQGLPAIHRAARLALCLAGAAPLLTTGASQLHAQEVTVAQFTFENDTVSNTAAATSPTFAPEVNTYSATTDGGLVHPGGVTNSGVATNSVYSFPLGNGSPKSFSANNWGTGGYFQFSVSTANATTTGVNISYSQAGSNTGPRDFALYYSTTGAAGMFTEVGNGYQLSSTSFTSNSTVNYSLVHYFDLSSITALDNNANDVFRVIDLDSTSILNSTVTASGTDRIDDFTVIVPEPGTIFGSVLIVAAFCGWVWRVGRNGAQGKDAVQRAV